MKDYDKYEEEYDWCGDWSVPRELLEEMYREKPKPERYWGSHWSHWVITVCVGAAAIVTMLMYCTLTRR